MKKAPYTNTKLSTFELDMAASTAANCIGETEGEFSKTEFQTPKHAHLVKQSLIDLALFKCLLEPLPAGDPGEANRNLLRTSLMQEKLKFNLCSIEKSHEEYVEKKVKMDLAQANSIVTTADSHLVVPPPLGTQVPKLFNCRYKCIKTQMVFTILQPFASAEIKSTINKLLLGEKFGQNGQSKPLKEYLTLLGKSLLASEPSTLPKNSF